MPSTQLSLMSSREFVASFLRAFLERFSQFFTISGMGRKYLFSSLLFSWAMAVALHGSVVCFIPFSSPFLPEEKEETLWMEIPGGELSEKGLNGPKRPKHIIEASWISDVLQRTLKEVDPKAFIK